MRTENSKNRIDKPFICNLVRLQKCEQTENKVGTGENMKNDIITNVKKKAYADVQVSELQSQSKLELSDLDYMLYLQFWLMYAINAYGKIEKNKLMIIAGEFEKAYGVVELNMRCDKKAKNIFYKLAKGEDVDFEAQDCEGFEAEDWMRIGEAVNKYFENAGEEVSA